MEFSTIVIIIIGFGIGGYFLEQFLRGKLNMEKKGFFGYKRVNSLHVKLDIGLFFVYIIASFIYMFKSETANISYAIFSYLAAMGIVRIWMERKYDRESKEYILSILWLAAYIFTVSILLYFVPPASY